MGILGASGSGKSMTLRCIAGIETPDEGRIIINGRTLFDSEKQINLKPQERRVGYLFQNYALFPKMTVEKNIACGFRGDKSRQKQKVQDYLERYQLAGLEKRYPSQLSGGQQQRVAIARVLSNNPEILLCDEATSALDPQTTKSILDLLKKINRERNITIVIITHSMSVVKDICNNVAVMENGEAVEIETVKELFENPKTNIAKKLVLIGGGVNLSQKELDEYVG